MTLSGDDTLGQGAFGTWHILHSISMVGSVTCLRYAYAMPSAWHGMVEVCEGPHRIPCRNKWVFSQKKHYSFFRERILHTVHIQARVFKVNSFQNLGKSNLQFLPNSLHGICFFFGLTLTQLFYEYYCSKSLPSGCPISRQWPRFWKLFTL